MAEKMTYLLLKLAALLGGGHLQHEAAQQAGDVALSSTN
jgi:hypothetical protein